MAKVVFVDIKAAPDGRYSGYHVFGRDSAGRVWHRSSDSGKWTELEAPEAPETARAVTQATGPDAQY